jgi:hypothetical protein
MADVISGELVVVVLSVEEARHLKEALAGVGQEHGRQLGSLFEALNVPRKWASR